MHCMHGMHGRYDGPFGLDWPADKYHGPAAQHLKSCGFAVDTARGRSSGKPARRLVLELAFWAEHCRAT